VTPHGLDYLFNLLFALARLPGAAARRGRPLTLGVFDAGREETIELLAVPCGWWRSAAALADACGLHGCARLQWQGNTGEQSPGTRWHHIHRRLRSRIEATRRDEDAAGPYRFRHRRSFRGPFATRALPARALLILRKNPTSRIDKAISMTIESRGTSNSHAACSRKLFKIAATLSASGPCAIAAGRTTGGGAE
jgi:hypothetical protein